jgi:hypothetical protein
VDSPTWADESRSELCSDTDERLGRYEVPLLDHLGVDLHFFLIATPVAATALIPPAGQYRRSAGAFRATITAL